MVKKIGQDKKLAKKVTCKNCSAILEYLPKDVKSEYLVVMCEGETYYHIDCPECKHKVNVK